MISNSQICIRRRLKNIFEAIRNRDIETLQTILSDDVTFYADGGEEMDVVKNICTGKSAVSKLLMFTYQKFQTTFSIQHAKINHQPALLFCDDHNVRVCQVYQFDGDCQKINRICTVLDPKKLGNII